jgi:transcriptional regulator with AAA-type ATPase domain
VAPHVLRLCQLLERQEEWLDALEGVLKDMLRKHGRRITYALGYY